MYEKKIIEFCFKRIEKAGKRRKRMKIILASASPRRKELLEQIGVKFLIQPAAGEEKITKTIPDEVVTELALQKAREVAKDREEPVLIIGADTVVAYQDEILGKPGDEKDAFRMLSMLQGKSHEVYTGVALLYLDGEKTKELVFAEKTKEINKKGVSVLLIEQNAKAALEISDYAYVLETGIVVLEGPGKELITNDEVKKAYLGA